MTIEERVTVSECLQDRIESRLKQYWHNLLAREAGIKNRTTRECIVNWLLAEKFNKLTRSNCDLLIYSETELCQIHCQTISYRYNILQKRYLGVSPQQAYRNLIDRLSSIVIVRRKLEIWLETYREYSSVSDILQEVIQAMLEKDRYLQKQNNDITKSTGNSNLANSLLLATLEEYCLRPIRDRPLLFYRVINFMVEGKRGGITQIPKNKRLRLVSPQKNTDPAVNLLDEQAIIEYQENKKWQERQTIRIEVIKEFEQYLTQKLGVTAAKWLRLYLQGHSQETTAKILNLPIEKVYRLREKINYHALKVFAIKEKPELIAQWLEISLREHNLGLTAREWHKYWHNLTPTQKDLINYLKEGNTLKGLCQNYNWKMTRVTTEWSKIYFAAQRLRNNLIKYN